LSTNSNQRSDSARRPDIINFSHAWRLTKIEAPGIDIPEPVKKARRTKKEEETKVAHKKGGGKSKNGRDSSRNASALRNMPGK